MKCPKCHVTMNKDYDSRTATCPICGKTKNYKSNADKKRGYRYYPEYENDGNYLHYGYYGHYGYERLLIFACITIIVLVVIIILLLLGVFKNGFWDGLGQIGMFILNLLWSIISFIGRTIWGFFTWLFHLVFG